MAGLLGNYAGGGGGEFGGANGGAGGGWFGPSPGSSIKARREPQAEAFGQ
jgi:hypothetical protein